VACPRGFTLLLGYVKWLWAKGKDVSNIVQAAVVENRMRKIEIANAFLGFLLQLMASSLRVVDRDISLI
jgi:hypothetical protein